MTFQLPERSIRYAAGLLIVASVACAAAVNPNLIGRPLFQKVSTVEGPIEQPVAIENNTFCRQYVCALTEPVEGGTGDATWVILPRSVEVGAALQRHANGTFYPQLTVHIEKNTVLFVNLALDTKVRSPMPAATLNLLGNFTRLVLGVPVSAQKLSGCYRSLLTEATCVVGRGQVRVGGVQRWYVAAFRTVDDGEGYSMVNYAIGLED